MDRDDYRIRGWEKLIDKKKETQMERYNKSREIHKEKEEEIERDINVEIYW